MCKLGNHHMKYWFHQEVTSKEKRVPELSDTLSDEKNKNVSKHHSARSTMVDYPNNGLVINGGFDKARKRGKKSRQCTQFSQ